MKTTELSLKDKDKFKIKPEKKKKGLYKNIFSGVSITN